MQTKRESFIEQTLNVTSGLVLSIVLIQPIVFKTYGIELSNSSNIQLALIFTSVSVIRGYVWRRWFNKRLLNKLKG
jgi:hypothetical protein